MKAILHIVSGIPPGSSGTGRLLSHLASESVHTDGWVTRLHFLSRPSGSIRQMLREKRFIALARDLIRTRFSSSWLNLKLRVLSFRAEGAVIVFHPQTLGFRRTLRVLRAWGDRAYIFGLDNSFFCIQSYNYIGGEAEPCMRCLGGSFDAAIDMRCKAFPVPDNSAHHYVRQLHTLLSNGEVGVFAQNERNAQLYRLHAGSRARVETIGLWTSDWDDAFEATGVKSYDPAYDVVFHGNFVPAKGSDWMMEVARRLPRTQFLFPTAKPSRIRDLPDNVTFKPMTWEDGLDVEVRRAQIVCVPSLWSATIEGALVKSIVCARAVARVNVSSAYGDELPEGLVLHLDTDPDIAARELKDALDQEWTPCIDTYDEWLGSFQQGNSKLLEKMLAVIKRMATKTAGSGPLKKEQVSLPEPRSDHGLVLETLGTSYGGWKVPVDCIKQGSICYCIGAGEDISFDTELVERFGCDVTVLDPTPRARQHIDELVQHTRAGTQMMINNRHDAFYNLSDESLERLHYYPYGVWSDNTIQRFYTPENMEHVSHSIVNLQKTESYFEAECRTLSGLMEEFGHNSIDVLKMDVEGAEYEVINSMLRDGIRPKVLCVEFDEGTKPLDSEAATRISDAFRKLSDASYELLEIENWNALFVRSEVLSTRH